MTIFTEIEDQKIMGEELDQDAVSVLVGEGKKFKDVDALARGKMESDIYIEQLQRELAEERERAMKGATVEQIMEQIRGFKQESPSREERHERNDSGAHQGQNEHRQEPDVEKLVQEILSRRESETRIEKNRRLVEETLSEKLGADAQIHLNRKARELGVSLQYLEKLAQDNPTVFFKTIDLDRQRGPAPQVVAPRGSVGVNSAPNSGARDSAFYKKLKASDPKKYREMQTQMYKDWMANPELFKDY